MCSENTSTTDATTATPGPSKEQPDSIVGNTLYATASYHVPMSDGAPQGDAAAAATAAAAFADRTRVETETAVPTEHRSSRTAVADGHYV